MRKSRCGFLLETINYQEHILFNEYDGSGYERWIY